MMNPRPTEPATSLKRPAFGEFVVMMAALMASNALAIDAMLPALPAIGEALDVDEDNRRQLVIAVYLLGFGVSQLFYGPLSDRLGRKWLLVGGLFAYALFALLAGLAGSFELLLAARTLQGVAAGATRVLVVSIVRDCYHGSAMARVMSMTMIVFMIVPVLAPAFGQAVLAVSTWRHIFIGLGVYGAVLTVWMAIRLPETLAPENKRSLSVRHIAAAAMTTLRIRQSIGNTMARAVLGKSTWAVLALTLLLGALYAFISSLHQIVFDVFGRPEALALVFAMIAGPMALSSYANSRLVMRLGARRILLFALSAFTSVSVAHLILASTVGEGLWAFVAMQAMTMIFFGMIGANAGALAMEPLGHVAGTASSLQGVITSVGGALIGFLIGQQFDGSIIPFLIGFSACGLGALATAVWANRTPCHDSHDVAEIEVQETATRPA